MLIKKINIKEHVPFTGNIEDRNINTHISDAGKYDLLNYLGQTLITALELISEDYSNWEGPWVPTTAYTVGQKVTHGNKVWKAVNATTGSEPSGTNADWLWLELASFWFANIKPYMAFNSCARYCVWAGRNFTQYGIMQPFDPSSQAVDSRDRAAIIKDLENKASVEFTNMDNALELAKWKFDNVQYAKPSDAPCIKRKKSFGISAID